MNRFCLQLEPNNSYVSSFDIGLYWVALKQGTEAKLIRLGCLRWRQWKMFCYHTLNIQISMNLKNNFNMLTISLSGSLVIFNCGYQNQHTFVQLQNMSMDWLLNLCDSNFVKLILVKISSRICFRDSSRFLWDISWKNSTEIWLMK